MVFAFGNCHLDVEKHELLRDGAVVPVEPQVFALLVHLVRERHRVVSKDELIEAIWEGRFVSDSAVSSRVKSARQALGDSGQTQSFIKTVHGKGFRFVADVHEIADEAAPRPPAPGRPVDPLSGRGWPGWLGSIAWGRRFAIPMLALLVVAVGAFLFLPRDGQAATGPVRVAVLPMQNATGLDENDWAELGLMSLVARRLEQEDGVNVVAPRAVIEMVTDEDLPRSGPLEIPPDVIARLRNTQGASHIAVSRLRRDDGLLRLDFAVLQSDGEVATDSVRGEKVAELADLMGAHILALVPGERTAPEQRSRLFDDPFVAEAFARGLALQLEGHAEEARNLFRVAAEQDPASIWPRYEYALCTRQMGLLDEAEQQLKALGAEAESSGDREARVAVLNALAVLEMRRSNDDTAIEYLEAALPFSSALDDRANTGTLLINLGILERRRENFPQAEDYLTRAFAEYEDAGITAPPGGLLNSMALLRVEQGRWDEATAYMERALERFRADGDARDAASVLNNLGDARESAGDYAGALPYYRQSYDERRRIDDPYGVGSSLNSLAQLAITTGRLDQAQAHAQALVDLGQESADGAREAQGLAYLGDVRRLRGDAAAARASYRRAIELFEANDRQDTAVAVRLQLALAEHGQGIGAVAVRAATQVRGWARANDEFRTLMNAEAALGRFAHEAGDLARAQSHYRAALAAAEQLVEGIYRGRMLAKLGLVAVAQGDLAAARDYEARAARHVPNDADLYRLRAQISQAAGRRPEAARFLAKARELSGQLWSREDERALAALRRA